jgi:hypothetical protein
MLKEVVDFYYCVPSSTQTCFDKWLPSSGGRSCLISYSSEVCVVGVYGLRLVLASCRGIYDNWPHRTSHNLYTPTTQILRELLIRHLRPPENGNHLPKYVGVELGTH